MPLSGVGEFEEGLAGCARGLEEGSDAVSKRGLQTVGAADEVLGLGEASLGPRFGMPRVLTDGGAGVWDEHHVAVHLLGDGLDEVGGPVGSDWAGGGERDDL